jgi:hypothetical protein
MMKIPNNNKKLKRAVIADLFKQGKIDLNPKKAAAVPAQLRQPPPVAGENCTTQSQN